MTYKTIISIPDQHIEAGQNLRRFDALGNLITVLNPDYVVNGGDMFDFALLYGISVKKNWAFKVETADLIDGELEAGYQAYKRMWDPILKEQEKAKKRKKKPPALPQRHWCIGNHDTRLAYYVKQNQEEFASRWAVNDPLEDVWNQNEFWEYQYPYQYPAEIEGILFCHNYVSGTNTTSKAETIQGLACQSAVGYHTHKAEFLASSTAKGDPVFILQSGWFADPDEVDPEWLGPQGGRNWWNGITILHGVDGTGRFEPEFMSTDRLIRDYL